MNFSRRQFVKGGVTAFTFGFAAPQMLCDIAFAQGVPSRNLVVVYLSGGNDSLSTVIPYRDPSYASRRPTLAIPAGNVLQIGTDSSNIELGLHPRLRGMKSIFDSGQLAIVQRTGYANQSRSHFTGFDIWGTASTRTHPAPDGSDVISTRSRRPRSACGVEHAARDAAPADGPHRWRARDHEPGNVCLLEPEHRRRGRLRADRADANLVASARRSPAPRVRQFDHASGAGNAGSRGHGGGSIGRRSPIPTTALARR